MKTKIREWVIMFVVELFIIATIIGVLAITHRGASIRGMDTGKEYREPVTQVEGKIEK